LQIKANKQKSPVNVAFENYLNLVSQIYYKANHQLNDLNNIIMAKDLIKPEEENGNILQVKKGNRPGRKAKPKILPIAPDSGSKPAQNSTSNNIGDSAGNAEADKGYIEPEIKQFPDSFSAVYTDILDALISPLKVDNVLEKWSPKEIAIFEAGLCKYGKEFSFIQFLINTKTLNEVIQFYFAWKTTTHYRTWKHYKNLDNKTNYNSWL